MTARCFVDANVLVYARDARDPRKQQTAMQMVVAAAQLQSCEVLLTEDLQDGEIFGSIRVRDPFLHEVRQPEAAYEVQPVARSAHRPRGRPRRAAAL